ncbi:MAG: di-trans,poly-cis-decaprenylcistransferase [Methylococcaceae bacterium]|nr:MAG: di-trans,poly-cis-decaprenylcistransferase [Methylococcaceae bacterium]
MDGNGRWAKQRLLPRTAGHTAGIVSVRKIVRYCADQGIKVLTLFAFSRENWRRPVDEVSVLMDLFVDALSRETQQLHDRGIRLQVIGERSAFNERLQRRIAESEALTVGNTGMHLVIAGNYGGRWDILQAAQQLAHAVQQGRLQPHEINESLLDQHLATVGLPEPDLLIRTGGEQRISNFLLWQMAYTELYFTPTLWPDFDEAQLALALQDFAARERRFGYTGEQVQAGI